MLGQKMYVKIEKCESLMLLSATSSFWASHNRIDSVGIREWKWLLGFIKAYEMVMGIGVWWLVFRWFEFDKGSML